MLSIMELTGLTFWDCHQQRCKTQVVVTGAHKALNCTFCERVRIEILFALHIERLLIVSLPYTLN